MTVPDDLIRASEIGHYAYCRRAWWYARVLGYRSSNQAELEAGQRRHRRHGRSVEGYHLLRRLGVLLIVLAGAVLLVWLAVTLVGG